MKDHPFVVIVSLIAALAGIPVSIMAIASFLNGSDRNDSRSLNKRPLTNEQIVAFPNTNLPTATEPRNSTNLPTHQMTGSERGVHKNSQIETPVLPPEQIISSKVNSPAPPPRLAPAPVSLSSNDSDRLKVFASGIATQPYYGISTSRTIRLRLTIQNESDTHYSIVAASDLFLIKSPQITATPSQGGICETFVNDNKSFIFFNNVSDHEKPFSSGHIIQSKSEANFNIQFLCPNPLLENESLDFNISLFYHSSTGWKPIRFSGTGVFSGAKL